MRDFLVSNMKDGFWRANIVQGRYSGMKVWVARHQQDLPYSHIITQSYWKYLPGIRWPGIDCTGYSRYIYCRS